MAKKTLWRLAIVLTLITTAFLLVQAGFFAVQGPPPAEPVAGPAVAPPAQPVAENPSPAAAANRSGQMKLADKPDAFTPAPAADDEYSYTLKKQSNERVILPGVTIMSGSGAKGVSIKTADRDETVQIKRDATYPTSAYQVMWQKKY